MNRLYAKLMGFVGGVFAATLFPVLLLAYIEPRWWSGGQSPGHYTTLVPDARGEG